MQQTLGELKQAFELVCRLQFPVLQAVREGLKQEGRFKESFPFEATPPAPPESKVHKLDLAASAIGQAAALLGQAIDKVQSHLQEQEKEQKGKDL